MKTEKFAIDDRNNPGLHMLHVKWACGHLVLIEKCIKKFNDTSNINMHGCMEALEKERDKLIKENAAYHDAWEIVQEMCKYQEDVCPEVET